VAGPVLLPEYRDPRAGRLDLASVALSLAAILPVIYGLKELARSGWGAPPLAAIAAGAAVGLAFVRRQRALADPLLDLRLFADRAFSAALGGMLFGTMLMGAIMVFITQYLQLVQGLSPLRAGLWMLPAAGATTSFLLSPLVARRVRPALLIGGGLTVSAVGLLAIALADATSGLAALVAGFAVINLGAGPQVTLGTNLVVGAAPPEKAGSAAAINETSGELGFALGIAALGSIGTAVYRAQLADAMPAGVPAEAVEAARETLAGAAAAAGALPAELGVALLDAAREAFTSGMHVVAAVSAVLLVGVAVLVATLLRHVRPIGEAEPDQPDQPGGVPAAASAPAPS
jgi:MFS transporter, DHA2 family, multidrug resistance protein